MGPNLSLSKPATKRHNIVRYDDLSRSKRLKPTDPDADVSTGAVKDLRSRRVFSPTGFDFRSKDTGDGEPTLCLCDTKGQDSNSRDKSVVKSSLRRKEFKVSGSHSYRRMLPFLRNMAKDDTCSFSVSPSIGLPKTEKSDLGPQDKVDLKALENEEMNNFGSELSREAQNLDDLNLSETVVNTRSYEDLNGNSGLGSNGVHISTAEHNVSKIEKNDLGISSNSINFGGTDPKFSCTVNDSKGEDEGRTDGAKSLQNENIKKLGTLLSCEIPNMDQPTLSGSKEGIQLDDLDKERNKNVGSSNGVEEIIQTTPPHVDIFSNPETNMFETEENPKSRIVVEKDSLACENTSKHIYLKNGSTYKSKVVLNPCSRGKVFKTPGSFSYRRLLPYLMVVSNNNPHNSDASNSPPHRRVTTDAEEKKMNTHLPMVDLNCQQSPTDECEASFSSTTHSGAELALNPPTAIMISNTDSSDNKQTLLSAENSVELQKPLNSPNKCVLPVEKVISNIIKDLEYSYGGENSEIEMTSTPNLSCPSGDNNTSQRDDAQSSSSQGTKAPALECLYRKSSQVEETVSFGNHVNSKGILRRNPRGCRGLCICLNCSSFRLNADKAFEFSRNQMLDAEEVALDLINELSGLRNMLKESTVNSHGQVTADIDKVMEACTKALRAEEAAKCRLEEMHCDLIAHCRSKHLERPSVKFANHVNKMVIPQVDSTAGNRKLK